MLANLAEAGLWRGIYETKTNKDSFFYFFASGKSAWVKPNEAWCIGSFKVVWHKKMCCCKAEFIVAKEIRQWGAKWQRLHGTKEYNTLHPLSTDIETKLEGIGLIWKNWNMGFWMQVT